MIRKKISAYANFVKLEHAIFSFPLIFAGMLLHARAWPTGGLFSLVLLAAISARTLAMGLNRIIDARLDALNPRTKDRVLVRGDILAWEAWAIVILAGVLYTLSAAAIAPICLWLSPIPVALFAIYPYLKRFTSLSHLGLGLAWSMAPLGGWLSSARSLDSIGEIKWLWLFSVLWVCGFDIIYATMDEAFDRESGLHSLPAMLGKLSAVRIAVAIHSLAYLALVALWRARLSSLHAFVWLLVIGALFLWQHMIALRRPAFAFFQINAMLGFAVLGFVVAGG